MTDSWAFIFELFGKLYNCMLPIGITFGSLIVAAFGLPVLVRAFRKLMG